MSRHERERAWWKEERDVTAERLALSNHARDVKKPGGSLMWSVCCSSPPKVSVEAPLDFVYTLHRIAFL